MAESGSDPSRLEALRERWERDPASRLFLQLAEEYRRDGQPEAALKVLETGLGHHPGYLAARVALGRCRLETGDVTGAAETLERVIAADPTQLVANKLLIATYLRLGRIDDARDRLDLYVLLNEADPEIAEIERQLAAAAAPPAAELPELPTAYGELEQFVERSAAVRDRPVAAAEPLAVTPRPVAALDLERLPLPDAARRRVDPARLPPPFPALAAPGTGQEWARFAGLTAAGIFRATRPAVAVPAPAVEEPFGAAPEVAAIVAAPMAEMAPASVEPEVELPASGATLEDTTAFEMAAIEPEPAVLPEAKPVAVREPEPELVAVPVPEPEPVSALAAAPDPEAVAVTEAELEAAFAAEPEEIVTPEPEPVAAPEASAQPWWALPRAEPPAASAPEEAVAAPLQAKPEPVPSAWVESEEVAVPPAEIAPSVAAGGAEAALEATPTLAALYLEQGHLGEATAAYEAILARQPGDPEALSGLARIRELLSRPPDAADLLGAGPQPAGLTARKILLLQRYLQRIREGAQRHVS